MFRKKLIVGLWLRLFLIFCRIATGDLLRTPTFSIAGIKLDIVAPISLQLENGVELGDDTYIDLNLRASLKAVIVKPTYYR